MTTQKLVRLNVQLTAKEKRDLRVEAAYRGCTASYIAREAIRNRHVMGSGKVGGELRRGQGKKRAQPAEASRA